jgi:dihydropteroate synthase
VESGVQIIRTHDVAETVQAVRMTEAILERQK